MHKLEKYWCLTYNPFSKYSLTNVVFKTHDYKQAHARCLYCMKQGEIFLLTGKSGTGKTYLLKEIIDHCNFIFDYEFIYIQAGNYKIFDFYMELCHVLNLDSNNCYKLEMKHKIQDKMLYYKNEKSVTPVLIIDNAELLDKKILHEIEFLLTFEEEIEPVVSVVLCGWPSLTSRLQEPEFERLRHMIYSNYCLERFSYDECKDYIEYMLKDAAEQEEFPVSIINDRAWGELYRYSNGNCRLVKNIVNAALMIGMQAGKKQIDETIVKQAKDEVFI